METTEIIILAAGKGTRMGADVPKCLVPVKGIPIIDRLLANLEKALVNKPLLVTGDRAEVIESHLGDRARYVRQLEQKGTAHAAQTALKALLPTTKSVVILYADHPFVSGDTVIKLLSCLDKNTIGLGTLDGGDFGGWKSVFKHWGRIIYSKAGLIEKVIEFKDADEATKSLSIVNPGFYAVKADWLKKALEEIQPNNAQGEYYLTDIIKIAQEEGQSIGEVRVEPFEAMGLNSKAEVEYAESLI